MRSRVGGGGGTTSSSVQVIAGAALVCGRECVGARAMSEFICSQGMWHGPVCLFLRGSCSVCVYFHAGAGVCSHVGMAVVRWACWCQFTREDYQHHISSSGHEGLLHDPAPSYLFILFLVLAWHPLLPSASFLSLSLALRTSSSKFSSSCSS